MGGDSGDERVYEMSRFQAVKSRVVRGLPPSKVTFQVKEYGPFAKRVQDYDRLLLALADHRERAIPVLVLTGPIGVGFLLEDGWYYLSPVDLMMSAEFGTDPLVRGDVAALFGLTPDEAWDKLNSEDGCLWLTSAGSDPFQDVAATLQQED